MTAHFDIYSVGQVVRWRLLAANNRDSGQSAVGYPTAEACREGLARLLGALGELQAHHVRTPGQRWQWQLSLGDEVLAQASRSFDRRHQCETACQWFIRMAPDATTGPRIRVVLSRMRPSQSLDGLPIGELRVTDSCTSLYSKLI